MSDIYRRTTKKRSENVKVKKKKKTKKKKKRHGHEWPKGVSGNPKGRPKGSKNTFSLKEFKEALNQIQDEEGKISLIKHYINRAYESDGVLQDAISKLLPSLRSVEGIIGTFDEVTEERAKEIQDKMKERFG